MAKRRLTKTEKEARECCANARTYGSATINVEWNKSRTWGYCPRVEMMGRVVARASGCGYDKLSGALATALRFLADDEAGERAIWGAAGCGESTLIRVLGEHGWQLTRTASGRMFDAFHLTYIGGES